MISPFSACCLFIFVYVCGPNTQRALYRVFVLFIWIHLLITAFCPSRHVVVAHLSKFSAIPPSSSSSLTVLRIRKYNVQRHSVDVVPAALGGPPRRPLPFEVTSERALAPHHVPKSGSGSVVKGEELPSENSCINRRIVQRSCLLYNPPPHCSVHLTSATLQPPPFSSLLFRHYVF